MTDAAGIAAALIGIVVLLAFVAYADKQTDLDEEERTNSDDEREN